VGRGEMVADEDSFRSCALNHLYQACEGPAGADEIALAAEISFYVAGVGLVARGQEKDGEVGLGMINFVRPPGKTRMQTGLCTRRWAWT
jgi:hypothetical protein